MRANDLTEMVERVARTLQSRDETFEPDQPLDPAFLVDARAVIAAMREPTEAMVEACDGMIEDAASSYDHWQRMIDAALAEQ